MCAVARGHQEGCAARGLPGSSAELRCARLRGLAQCARPRGADVALCAASGSEEWLCLEAVLGNLGNLKIHFLNIKGLKTWRHEFEKLKLMILKHSVFECIELCIPGLVHAFDGSSDSSLERFFKTVNGIPSMVQSLEMWNHGFQIKASSSLNGTY